MPWSKGLSLFTLASEDTVDEPCAALFKRMERAVSTVPTMLKRMNSAAIAASLTVAAMCPAQQPGTSPSPVVTQWFAFHNNQWVNLHHFLYVTARAREGLDATRASVVRALADTAGFGQLSVEQKAAWANALDYYTKFVAKRDILFDSSLVDVNNRLAALERASTVGGTPGLDTGIASALDRAAPAYRALWWPRHDAANRRWIAAIVPMVRDHGAAAVHAEERIFRHDWSATPVRVDVSAYTNWAGAYTTEDPGHINVSSDSSDLGKPATFETMFHEVLHTMDDSVFRVLQTSFKAQKKRWFRDPTHPFIFYTAGELTRREFPGYVPFAESAGLWARNSDFVKILPMLREYWQPYLDGKSSLEEAMRQIAEHW